MNYIANDDFAVAEALAEFVGVKLDESHREGGKINMCKAWEDQKKVSYDEGVREEKVRAIRNMLDNNLDEKIIVLAGYTIKDIEEVRKLNND